jgi:transcriptional regulator with XRE-family HTH domain
MLLTPEQCRAARSLLDWTQDKLAESADVSRATIADFENCQRSPNRSSLHMLAQTFFAAGVDLIPEEDSNGVGVRLRARRLRYVNSVKIDTFNDCATIPMEFSGRAFKGVIDLDAIDDLDRSQGRRSEEEYRQSLSAKMPLILSAAERAAEQDLDDGGKLLISYEMLAA